MARRRRLQHKSPAYQWYPKDYQTDAAVVLMTLAQEGAYRRLMDVCWLENGLPTDTALLWRLAKADSRDHFERELWPVMYQKFSERDGKLHHSRLDVERKKQRKNRKARQLAAKARWEKGQQCGDANALQTPSIAFPIAIATAVRTKNNPPFPPFQGGRLFTKRELKAAAKERADAFGRCPHDPKCEIYQECIELFAVERRLRGTA